MNDKIDNSINCNFNDEDINNNCFKCIHFIFPIGCMFYEDIKEEE